MQRKTTEYDVIETGIYKGIHQLKLGYLGKDGEFKPKTYKYASKGGGEFSIPITVPLGDKAEAIEFMVDYLKELAGTEYIPNTANAPARLTEDDDIPF